MKDEYQLIFEIVDDGIWGRRTYYFDSKLELHKFLINMPKLHAYFKILSIYRKIN